MRRHGPIKLFYCLVLAAFVAFPFAAQGQSSHYVQPFVPGSGNANLIAAIASLPGHYTRDVAWSGSGTTLTSPGRMAVNINGEGYYLSSSSSISLGTAANWDSTATDYTVEANRIGKDFYVYACAPTSGSVPVLKLSANATVPTGYTSGTSRKVAGFHYGYVRNSITVADVSTGIVPNSVWDQIFRPKCSPEGMVYVGAGLWVDIYLVSADEAIVFSNGNGSPLTAGTGKSAYGAVPLTGMEGLSGYNFVELARRSGKRLLTYAEWLQAAHGHPAGNQYAGNTTTRGTTGENASIGSISLANVVDCARKCYQWLGEYTIKQDTTSWAWQTPMAGMNVGNLYLPNSSGISQFLAGGNWGSGSIAGPRAVALHSYPWGVDSVCGSRFACDSL